MKKPAGYHNHDKSDEHRHSHALQIDKRRITQYAGISVENAKAYDIEQHVHAYSSGQLPKKVGYGSSSMEEIAYEYGCGVYDDAVYHKDTPIWQ